MIVERDAYRVLQGICEDFQQHLESGGNPNSVKPDSVRYFSQGNEPGEAVQYLERLHCVKIQRWEPDYALGGNTSQFLVIPTEYGVTVFNKSKEQGKLTFLPPE